METQSDDALTREEKKGLFTGRFKVSLVLLSDTRQSAGGEPGESQDDTNNTDPSRRETNKRKKNQQQTIPSYSGQRAVVSERVSLL